MENNDIFDLMLDMFLRKVARPGSALEIRNATGSWYWSTIPFHRRPSRPSHWRPHIFMDVPKLFIGDPKLFIENLDFHFRPQAYDRISKIYFIGDPQIFYQRPLGCHQRHQIFIITPQLFIGGAIIGDPNLFIGDSKIFIGDPNIFIKDPINNNKMVKMCWPPIKNLESQMKRFVFSFNIWGSPMRWLLGSQIVLK